MTDRLKTKNRRFVITLTLVVAAMIGMSYAAVPLYDLFCRVTGFGGTTQVAEKSSGKIGERVIKVRFDASLNGAFPWAFQPAQREIRVKVGETAIAYYKARNDGGEKLTGTATFNVTPLKAGLYFNKIDCFCFREQTLDAGQTVDMPVTFFVDPEIVKDRNLDDVDTITLSYTFFEIAGKPGNESVAKSKDGAGSNRTIN